jgi:hypothetical protein
MRKVSEGLFEVNDFIAHFMILWRTDSLLGNAKHTRTRQYIEGVMQPVCRKRIGKHAHNNRDIVGNAVFYSVRAKWL